MLPMHSAHHQSYWLYQHYFEYDTVGGATSGLTGEKFQLQMKGCNESFPNIKFTPKKSENGSRHATSYEALSSHTEGTHGLLL